MKTCYCIGALVCSSVCLIWLLFYQSIPCTVNNISCEQIEKNCC